MEKDNSLLPGAILCKTFFIIRDMHVAGGIVVTTRRPFGGFEERSLLSVLESARAGATDYIYAVEHDTCSSIIFNLRPLESNRTHLAINYGIPVDCKDYDSQLQALTAAAWTCLMHF